MLAERGFVESSTFNVEAARSKEITALRQAVDEAFRNRTNVSWWVWSQKGDFRKSLKLPKDAPNGVFLEDPHLYPYLVKFACEKIGLRGDVLKRSIRRIVKHETQHLIPVIGTQHVQTRLGGYFYKLVGLPFFSIFQPVMEHQGELTLHESIDMLANVNDPSPGDTAKLKRLKGKLD
jgi:hypothetical protein